MSEQPKQWLTRVEADVAFLRLSAPEAVAAIEADARTLDADRLRDAWLEHRRKAPGIACSPENCATYIAAEYGQAPASLDVERLRKALERFGMHTPYCQWVNRGAECDCGYAAALARP